MARDGKLVVRPDTGDPVKVVCGDPDAAPDSPEFIGAYRCLWDTFGGKVNSVGYRELDSHVGLIYGDSITLQRQASILAGLEALGFVSHTCLGIGSFTYQYVTRDTFGFAVKATYGEVNGQPREIYKAPKTDKKSEKKSARGLLRVDKNWMCRLELKQQCTREEEQGGELRTVFLDGGVCHHDSLADIRYRLHGDSF